MYTIVLAAALTAGNAAPGADIYEDIRDIKKDVEVLRQGQQRIEAEGLKIIIAGLRQRLTDEKLDELRRDIRDLRYEEVIPGAVPLPMPGAAMVSPVTGRSVITLRLPAGATFFVGDREIAVPTTNPTFVTPVLEPGKDYFYDFKVSYSQDGKTVTRVKRVTVRSGGIVRLSYEDMEVR